MPWLRAEVPDWREFVIWEYDYPCTTHATKLGMEPRAARLFMVFDRRYKLMHAKGGLRPMLFDLEKDPDEFHDLAKGETHAAKIARPYEMLAQWGRRMSQRVTKSDGGIKAMRGASLGRGVLPFMSDGTEVDEKHTAKYLGPVRQTDGPARTAKVLSGATAHPTADPKAARISLRGRPQAGR
jgi:hypothetical protein